MSKEELLAEGVKSLQEAVRFAGLSKAQLYRLMDRGELPFVKHGTRRLIPHRALVNVLAKDLIVAGPAAAPAA